MVLTPSTMLPIGTPAPDFSLPDTTGATVSRDDFTGAPALLVMFLCNHCPYVIHVRDGLAAVTRRLMEQGVAVVGINANDVVAHPADSPERMVEEKAAASYPFPYLYDEDQSVARAFSAACTPDFFLFDAQQRLVYRGQMDGARPSNDIPVTGEALTTAVADVLARRPVSIAQRPSMGCNIKWKPGNEPV